MSCKFCKKTLCEKFEVEAWASRLLQMLAAKNKAAAYAKIGDPHKLEQDRQKWLDAYKESRSPLLEQRRKFSDETKLYLAEMHVAKRQELAATLRCAFLYGVVNPTGGDRWDSKPGERIMDDADRTQSH